MIWDGTFGSLERDTFPDMVSIAVPFLGKSLVVPGMHYRDGSLSRVLMTNDEWDALPDERRKALTVDPSWEWKG